ncbi:hypothetical protein QQ020_20850 [Fulvivirgaceae bacterium BMA12]|uniref:Peptidase E n=1 Tax=Agaribacillus aureus TaxID=3051825 RepID=A0ABT8LBX4_9BACT|nr:hypothetical protein [Fulvivirgaceae bacterium BMA12]
MIKITALGVLLLGLNIAHPFHVSVCEIDYNDKNKALEITQKIFLDDLEEGLTKYSGEHFDITEKVHEQKVNQLLEVYYPENMQVKINGKPRPFRYLGFEMEADAMWCYLEIEKVKNLKSLEVTNTLLFETFDDQSTILHIQKDEKIRSFRLTSDEPTAQLQF